MNEESKKISEDILDLSLKEKRDFDRLMILGDLFLYTASMTQEGKDKFGTIQFLKYVSGEIKQIIEDLMDKEE